MAEGYMPESVFRRESAAEYFKELVEGALAHQRLNAGELTSYYVVNLLTGFLQRPAGDDAPLAIRLAQALESGGLQQRTTLKEIGDLSLFVSGFFSDSLRRKLVDVDYYVSIGGCAYNALSRVDSDTLSPVFGELSEKFVGFVDVLSAPDSSTRARSNPPGNV